MSLEEGAINYTDLSPNANIQGHQIADKTLRLRNFSDDTFGIANKISSNIPSFVATNPGGGTSATLTIPHGQPNTPVVDVYVSAKMIKFSDGSTIALSYIPAPIYNRSNASVLYFGDYLFPTNSGDYPCGINYGVDSTNVYILAYCSMDIARTFSAIPVTCFVLQESAAS